MPETVVDFFEPIDVEEEYGEIVLRIPLGTGHASIKAVHEKITVAQAGQSIMKRGVPELLLGAASYGDLALQMNLLLFQLGRSLVDLEFERIHKRREHAR